MYGLFSRRGLPSSSTFTLEDSAYQTSEQSTIEMDNDAFDVYLVSHFSEPMCIYSVLYKIWQDLALHEVVLVLVNAGNRYSFMPAICDPIFPSLLKSVEAAQ